MESELYRALYHIVVRLGKTHSFKGLQFSDDAIVLTYFWAVLNDRPMSWSCTCRHWPTSIRRRRVPSVSTLSRRLRTSPVQRLINRVEQELRSKFGHHWCKWIDAKPLPVGGASKDRDATCGWGAGRVVKGYKLHAICDFGCALGTWQVHPMNEREPTIAVDLITQLSGEGYLVGDNAYDSNTLYDHAAEHGYQLIAPQRKSARGIGKRRHSPHRLRGLELLSKPYGRGLLEARKSIERFFAHLTTFPGGLSPLPAWVRKLPRVRLWVQVKLIIHATRQILKQGLMKCLQ